MTDPFRWTSTGAACIGAVLLLAAGGAAGADEPDLASELLEELHEKGDIDDARYEELKALGKRAPVSATPDADADAPEWDARWSNGFKIERSDGAFELKFGGRIQNDWAAVGYSDAIERDVSPDDGFGTEFRRARLFFQGTVYERAFFKAQYEFAGGETEFKDVYMGLLFGDTNVRVGHFKEPFSLEELGSAKYLTFLERGLPNALVPSRNTGIQLQHHFLEDRGTFSTGFFVVTDDFGDRGLDDWVNSDNYDIASRLTFLPMYEDEGEKLVHLGVGYVHGFRNDQTSVEDGDIVFDEPVAFSSRPEVHLADRLIATPEIGATGTDTVGAELAAVLGPFSFQTEYVHIWVDGDRGAASTALGNGSPNVDYWGVYAEASYFLTGEHRNYDRKNAYFGRVKPKADFDPSSGDWGAFEVALRYSRLDLRDRGFGSKLNDYTVGLNWYLFPNLRVMANYIYAQRTAGGSANAGQVRFQVDF